MTFLVKKGRATQHKPGQNQCQDWGLFSVQSSESRTVAPRDILNAMKLKDRPS